MELYVYDSDFKLIAVIDGYQSLIWNENFWEPGDFNAEISYTKELRDLFCRSDYPATELYCRIAESDVGMVVENVKVTQTESEHTIVVSGRSFESMLDRRTVYPARNYVNEDIQTVAEELIKYNIGASAGTNRAANFVYVHNDDPWFSSADNVNAEYLGDNLLDAMINLCQTFNISFTVRLNDQNMFEVKLVHPKNRSESQTDLPFVTFGDTYDNLTSSTYEINMADFRTAAIVQGKYDTDEVVYADAPSVYNNIPNRLRREIFISNADAQDPEVTDENYIKQLKRKGTEELQQYLMTSVLDGEVDVVLVPKLGVDYDMGDIVQIKNSDGFSTPIRIVSYIRSSDETGYSEYPSFENLEGDET